MYDIKQCQYFPEVMNTFGDKIASGQKAQFSSLGILFSRNCAAASCVGRRILKNTNYDFRKE